MSAIWSQIPTWQFFWEKPDRRCHVKVVPSVSVPEVGEVERDDFISIRTLLGQTGKLVGYTFMFKPVETVTPAVRSFGWSVAASYGIVDSDEIVMLLDSPHIRIVKAGTRTPTYHLVLRHK